MAKEPLLLTLNAALASEGSENSTKARVRVGGRTSLTTWGGQEKGGGQRLYFIRTRPLPRLKHRAAAGEERMQVGLANPPFPPPSPA